VNAPTDARQLFVDAVRTNLDTTMSEGGFPLNGVHDGDEDPPNRTVSVHYEGVVREFLDRYPGLDPVWDEEWRNNMDGCVDIWIKWSEADDKLEANLEHWEISKLAERYGGPPSVTEVEAALHGPGDIQQRVEVLSTILKRSLKVAST
jgi:hypothetical protein